MASAPNSLRMKIAAIACTPLAATPPRPVQFSIGTFSTFYAALVEVRTDDGLVGIGECIVRRAPEVVTTIVDRLLAPALIGRDPWDVEGLWDDMFTLLRRWGHSRGFVVEAMSGIDIALWDLLARSVGKPLYKFLGGAGRDRVRCYVSKVYFDEIPKMADEARRLVAEGHTAIKVQLGWPSARGGHHADVQTVRAIREAVGPRVEIMLDANGAYDIGTAVRVGRQLEEFDVAWLEEPVPADDLEGYAHLRRSVRVPLAAGETEFGLYGFRDLIARGCVDVLQPEVARIGGVTAARRLWALAHAHNLLYAPHTGFSGGVAHLASLHLAAAAPNFYTYEYMGTTYIQNPLRDIFTVPFPAPQDGLIALPQAPGLGLDVDREAIRRHAVR
ncbi:MAG TPA: mandelate racemase/muconate lactonizing enzyme family protein [bacterium]|nr:mandelate racemase/muconate lactonizing enzyme family protein [bacterium]